MSANFSDLQQITTSNNTDQMMVRIDNGATGPDGFGRITISNLRKVFTESLTAADSKVKQASAQWDAAYSQVSSNSSVFTQMYASSADWSAAYTAITGDDYNLGNKYFNFVRIVGSVDTGKIAANTPLFSVNNSIGGTLSSNLVEIIPYDSVVGTIVDSSGRVGVNYQGGNATQLAYNFSVQGNAVIDNTAGTGYALVVNGDTFFNGSLSALSATYVTSTVTNTSAISVSSSGPGPALAVQQYGTGTAQPIARFSSDNASITIDGAGSLSALNNLYGTGKIVFGPGNTSTAAYSYVLGQNNSDNNLANVFILGSNVTAPAANYTYVNNLSSAGLLHAGGYSSTDWNSVYSNVNATSSSWSSVYSSFNAQSAANASVYSSVNATSANWGNAYSTTNANSAYWNSGGNILNTFAFVIGNASSSTPTHSLTAASLSSNADVAIVAKGTGATLAQIPTSTVTGGNVRGQYATDLQKSRALAREVASGNYSVIVGGYGNTASGTHAVAAGGESLTASGSHSTIAGGASNIASGDYSSIAGGTNNTASGTVAGIFGGGYNTASANYSCILGGSVNSASGGWSTIIGGNNNNASGLNSSVLGGNYNSSAATYSTTMGRGASATNYGEFAHSAGYYFSPGDLKSSTILTRTTTSAAGSAVCYLDGSSATQEITMPINSTYAFTTTIVGLSSHADSSGLHYILRGFAKCNNSGVVTVYNTTAAPALTQRNSTLNASMSAAGNKLRVVVYSPVASTFYWHAKVQGEFLKF